MVNKRIYLVLAALLLLTLLSGTLSGCSSKAQAGIDHTGMAMASLDTMPAQVKSAPVTVQQAYQFAAANPELLKQIPCYCGCGEMGHTSNYSCYIQEADARGKAIRYDDHALGCSICVDITQDTMRMLNQGKSSAEIRSAIDNTYSKYGPSNIGNQ